MLKASATATLSGFFQDLLRLILSYPFWWYTKGLLSVLRWSINSLKSWVAFFGLGVWIKNLFVPMYGDNSFTGRAISVFIRFFVIIFQAIAVLGISIMIFSILVAYVLVLPISITGFIYFFSSGLFL